MPSIRKRENLTSGNIVKPISGVIKCMMLQCMPIICSILYQFVSIKEVVFPLQKENILEGVDPMSIAS